MLGDFNDRAATGTQPLAERSVLHSPLSWDRDLLEPGAAQRTAPNLALTPPGTTWKQQRRNQAQSSPSSLALWLLPFTANLFFRNAEGVKYEDRNCQ